MEKLFEEFEEQGLEAEALAVSFAEAQSLALAVSFAEALVVFEATEAEPLQEQEQKRKQVNYQAVLEQKETVFQLKE